MCDQDERRPGWFRILLDLTKGRITIAVTVTTGAGYFLAARHLAWDIWMPLVGTYLLASGASALDEWQESAIDARMQRTRNRPIPARRIQPTTALFVSVLLILAGLGVLTSDTDSPMTLLVLGLAALIWYNGVYVYLKRVTAFAVVPGALIGALPPVIGYVAGGGGVADPEILLVASFFFVWQIPHFWLLLMMIGDQYRDAGLPTLTDVFSLRQLARVTFMWMLATAVGGMIFGTLAHELSGMAMPWSLVIVVASVWLASKGVGVLGIVRRGADRAQLRRAFMQINGYALVIVLCLSLNALGVRCWE